MHIPVVTQRRFVGVAGAVDERIVTIAAVQEGRVARWQLLQAGVTDEHLRSRLRRGLLIRVHRGVYALGHAGATARSEEVSALLTRGPGALICSHRAAGLWGLRPMNDGVDLLVPDRQGGGSRPGIRIHRSGDPDRLRPEYLAGVPLVAPAWALLEIAGDLAPRALEVALCEAFASGRVNRDEVGALVRAQPNRPGAGRLAALLGQRPVSNPSGSTGQEQLLALIRAAGLPDPEMDAAIGGGFSADMFWRRARVAAEFDSFRWHSTRRAWARDRRKDAHCRREGIALVRVTQEDLDCEALAIIARLSGLIAAASVAPR
jgi:hypothetical protein